MRRSTRFPCTTSASETNNIPINVAKQQQAGVNAIILDRIGMYQPEGPLPNNFPMAS
eukprot:m.204175 g.204175  ORF g.204175 m.204175 type:complete len:57 (-) comp10116_c0_seq12:317-487(-)